MSFKVFFQEHAWIGEELENTGYLRRERLGGRGKVFRVLKPALTALYSKMALLTLTFRKV